MKGARLLTEGRVIVTTAAPGRFAAAVRGSGELQDVRFGRGGWSCTCPARSTCSHLYAAALIAAPSAAHLIREDHGMHDRTPVRTTTTLEGSSDVH